jgi:rare lipoprotein A (peptidoglycan hydrolase)
MKVSVIFRDFELERQMSLLRLYRNLFIIFTAILIVCLFMTKPARADELKASWYSLASLKRDGQWKITKGVCADGSKFNDNDFTCACRLYPLGSYLLITNVTNGKTVRVKVTDRIGKRFAIKRVDLSKGAFSRLAKLERGIIPIKVEVINGL